MSQPFVQTPHGERPAELGYCSECGKYYWTDWGHHDCPVRSWGFERMLIVAATIGLLLWLLIIAGVWKATR